MACFAVEFGSFLCVELGLVVQAGSGVGHYGEDLEREGEGCCAGVLLGATIANAVVRGQSPSTSVLVDIVSTSSCTSQINKNPHFRLSLEW